MQQVILREDVQKLGKTGDLVNVVEGYARNFLLPQKKAVEATPRNLKKMEHTKRLIQDQIKKELKSAEALANSIQNCSLTFSVQAGEEGKLFGSISSKDIAEELGKQGVQIDRRQIHMEKPLKELGQTSVSIKIHQGVTANVQVTLVKEPT